MVPDWEKSARSHFEEGGTLCTKNDEHSYTNYALLQFSTYYYILHFSLSQVPYMRGQYIITSDQYIFFLIFRVTQTSRIWGSMYVQLSQNHHFRTFWLITLWGPSRMSYGLVKLFCYHICICLYSVPDKFLRVWVSTLSALFIDFGWRRTVLWIAPQKLLIPGWRLVCVYP
jgi:hypothetical protein